MELPWLKNKNKYAGGGGVERDSDESNPNKLIEAVAEELLSAWDRKDRSGFREALRAFVLMIKDQDRIQDASDARQV